MSDDRKASARGDGDGGRVFDAAPRGLGSRWEPKPKPAQQNDNRHKINGQKQEKKEGSRAPKGRKKKEEAAAREAAAREAAALLATASVAAAAAVATGAAAEPINSDAAASANSSATSNSSIMTNPTMLEKIGNSDSPLLVSALMIHLERNDPEVYRRAS